MLREDARKGHRPALFLLIGLLIVLQVTPALLRPAEFVMDDSYFYLQIARNIVRGLGGTFHGITPTNGYHPLWMAGAVAAVFLANEDTSLALQAVVVMQALLAVATAVLFRRFANMMGLQYWFIGAAAIMSYLLGTGLYGSEAHLNAMLLVAGLVSLCHTLENDSRRAWFTTGLVFGLAILARLDNVFVVVALGGLGVLHDLNRKGGVAAIAKRAGLAAGGGALILVPYLAYNAIQYGHLVPISGAIKSTFPSFRFDLERLGTMGMLVAPFGVVALIIGQFLDESQRRKVFWRGLGAGVVLHAVYTAGFTDHYTFWPWYYVSGVLAAALVGAYLPQWVGTCLLPDGVRAAIRPFVMVLTLTVLLGGAARAWLKAFNPIRVGPVTVDVPINEYRWPVEFARWMKEHMPADSGIFAFDWPGAIAYYSDLRVLPMDGLVNDFRYNDELLATGAQGYLCAHDLHFFFGLLEQDEATQQIVVNAPLYRKPAGVLTLHPEDILVKTRDVVSRPDEALPFAIWRLNCPGS